MFSSLGSRAVPLQEIGAKTIDLEWVQVHPTGLVKPDDADAKIKFLAAEAPLTVTSSVTLLPNRDSIQYPPDSLGAPMPPCRPSVAWAASS